MPPRFSDLREEFRPMFALAAPVVVAELGWITMGMVDTLMVGPLGAEAIGAVGLGSALFIAVGIFGLGMLLGLDTVVSQAFGAGRLDECHRWLLHGCVLALLLTVPTTALLFWMSATLDRWGLNPEVLRLVRPYLDAVAWSALPLLLYFSFRRYLQGLGVVRPIMITLIVANLLNVAANWILIYGHLGAPALGVAGSAWATVLARVVMLVSLVVVIVRRERHRRAGLLETPLTVEWARLRRLIALGAPAAGQLTLEVGVFAAGSALAGRMLPASLAAHQIALNLAGFTYMVPLGLASAGAVRVGHAIGRGDAPGAARAGWTALLFGVSFMSVAALTFIVIPRVLLGAFTTDQRVVELGVTLLAVAAVFQLFDGLQGVATGVLRGLGDTRTPMFWNLGGHWGIGLPLAYLLAFRFGFGVIGLWWGLSSGLIICGIALLAVWWRRIHAVSHLPRRARFAGMLLACIATVASASPAGAQALPDRTGTGTIRGVVLDRADGSPISDVSVRIENAGAPVTTDAAGRFELSGVTAGRHVLYVSVIGFILVRRPIDVVDGTPLDLTIVLSEGTGTYTETVEVAGERFREQEKSVPSQLTLGSADIQNLRNLLTNDPMRAIQVLPGITTGDDFHSEFAVRGSPFPRMNFTFDGVPTALLLHTVPQVQDGGSIAMLNGDILDGITLLNGSYPQRYGNRLGAELDFHMREGSRNRTQMRVGVSGTDASVVVEGPLGRSKAGSWLVSLRKSYLELSLKQVSDENDDFGFGFSDVQSKLTYDLSSRHRFELSLVAGRSRLDDQGASPDDINDVADGRNRAGVVTAAWRFAVSPRLVVTERIAAGAQVFRNRNAAGFELGSGTARELTWRTDFAATPRRSVTVEGGGQIQSHHRDEMARVFAGGPAPLVVTAYDDGVRLASAYGQARWTRSARASATAGARVDHWSLTGDADVSPWLQADLQLPAGLKLRGGTGIYRQFPGIPELSGTHGRGDLRTERAYHADAGIEQSVGASARWQFTLYNREERDLLRLPASELRVVDGALLGISLSAPWANTLTGYARGAELLVQRRSNTGLTGWLSYSFGVNRYRDVATGETFDGDFDQRHTLNAYGLYRLSNRFSLMGKLRLGSNTPAIGYWEQRGDMQFVGSTRNDLRLPLYSRLDVRANRTFNWESKRLTLFVEVMNVLNRDNVRYETPGVNGRTFRAFGMFATMIPLVPSAGILIEF